MIKEQDFTDLANEGIEWDGKEMVDLSKCVLYPVSAKPKGWSWGKLVEVVKATGLIVYATPPGGNMADIPSFPPQTILKPIDLSGRPDGMSWADYIKSIKEQ